MAKVILKQITPILGMLFLICSGCDNLSEPTEKGVAFTSIKSDLNDFDELIYSEDLNDVIFIKNQDNGLPESILILPDNQNGEHFGVFKFDEHGMPTVMNLSGITALVSNISGNTFDLTLINNDDAVYVLNKLDAGIDLEHYWQSVAVQTKSQYTQSSTQNAANLINHAVGGVTMFAAGVGLIAAGCVMLIPGVNVVAGASLAIAVPALLSFTSAALTTTRATDLFISDGSHTEGFDTIAGILGDVQKLPLIGADKREILDQIINREYDASVDALLYVEASDVELIERAQRFVDTNLTTGYADVDNFSKNYVTLKGVVSHLMDINDTVGIYISEVSGSDIIKEEQKSKPNQYGVFECTFSDLTPLKQYFYRAYYESSVLKRSFIASERSFIVPGVQTGSFTKLNDGEYSFTGKAAWDNLDKDKKHVAGICYSTSNNNPTISDNSVETILEVDGEYNLQITVEEKANIFYRAFAKINGDIVYGETKSISKESNNNKWVDLGLPSGILWAAYNVGASSPEESGGYYAWGETEEKVGYNQETYHTYISEICISGSANDVATVKWGDGARMPTIEDLKELKANCDVEYSDYNGIRGCYFIGPNENSIFIPYSGLKVNPTKTSDVYKGYIWSGTREGKMQADAYAMILSDDSIVISSSGSTHFTGIPVRPVKKNEDQAITLSIDSIEFHHDGGECVVSLTATTDWVFKDPEAEWIAVTPKEGHATASPVNIRVLAHPNDNYDQRSSTIYVAAGNNVKSISIIQEGARE